MSRRTAIVTAALLAVATAVLLVIFVLRLSESPGAKVQLGDPVFEVGQVRRLAPPIRRQGPLLFPDLLRRNRTVYVQHLGDEPTQGWLAFEAHRPDGPASCQLRWRPASTDFVDPCDGRTYPADGTGLVQFKTEVRNKKKAGATLYVDLRTGSGTGQ
jgi:hypothetical protein